MSQIPNLDWSILNWIHIAFQSSFLDFAMPKITALGSGAAVWIACALFLLLFRRYRRRGLLLLIGLVAGALVGNVILKNVVARPRPCWLNPGIPLLVPMPTDYSFPSGHALSSFLAATILGKTDRKFGFVAFPLAALIAVSRLYLYVHFPSDVLCGALIGMGIGYLTSFVDGKIRGSAAQKREDAVIRNKRGKKIRHKINRRPSQIKNRSLWSQGHLKRREREKSSVRAKIEHVFAVVKGMFRYRKTRYRGLPKQVAALSMRFTLANLILAGRPSLAA